MNRAITGKPIISKGEKLQRTINELLRRRAQLERMIEEIDSSEKELPEGRLRIAHNHGHVQYYACGESNPANNPGGIYISKKNMPLIQGLAIRSFHESIKKGCQKELSGINALLVQYGSTIRDCSPEKVISGFGAERITLIGKEHFSTAGFRNEWLEIPFKGKEFSEDTPFITTTRGERVRSKSEKIIADKLHALDIPYKYECPLFLKGYGTIYPDFTLLNIHTREEAYLEHFGLLSDADYLNKALKKIELYEQNGIFPGKKLFITYETQTHCVDDRLLARMLEELAP
ncbi:MAG: hypothetical protein K6A74_02865 [Lachnospiraceae bacterium]|nr:hypothetical protein [Lachnospiraceae bacterium]